MAFVSDDELDHLERMAYAPALGGEPLERLVKDYRAIRTVLHEAVARWGNTSTTVRDYDVAKHECAVELWPLIADKHHGN